MRPWSHIVIIAVMLTLYSASKHTKNAPWPNLATQYNITKITHWRCQKIQYVMDMQLESWVIKTNIWHSVIAFRLHSQTQQQQQQYRIHRRLGLFFKKTCFNVFVFFSAIATASKRNAFPWHWNRTVAEEIPAYTLLVFKVVLILVEDGVQILLITSSFVNVKIRGCMEPYCEHIYKRFLKCFFAFLIVTISVVGAASPWHWGAVLKLKVHVASYDRKLSMRRLSWYLVWSSVWAKDVDKNL